MPTFHVTQSVLPGLDPHIIQQLALAHKSRLQAIDSLDITDILEGRVTLSPEDPQHQAFREYSFAVEETSRNKAQQMANAILAWARIEQDKPLFEDFQEFSQAYLVHSDSDVTKDAQRLLRARIERNDEDVYDVVIYAPRQEGDQKPPQIYYRDDAGEACLDLLRHFTQFQIED